MNAAASAFDNGYTLALAITTLALAAGSAFTYRYLKRQPTASTEQAQHPEPAQHGRCRPQPTGSVKRTRPGSHEATYSPAHRGPRFPLRPVRGLDRKTGAAQRLVSPGASRGALARIVDILGSRIANYRHVELDEPSCICQKQFKAPK